MFFDLLHDAVPTAMLLVGLSLLMLRSALRAKSAQPRLVPLLARVASMPRRRGSAR
jgi:hypothetical protein